jgi:hypothetical protein
MLARDHEAYEARKAEYTERVLTAIEHAIPGFGSSISRVMSGTPVTYQTWTHRYRGMVGDFRKSRCSRLVDPVLGWRISRLGAIRSFPANPRQV